MLAVLVALSGLALAQDTIYKNAQYKFSFSYPKGWVTREGVMGTVVFVAIPPQGKEFANNLNVVVSPVPAGTKLEDVTKATVGQLENVITDFKVISQKPGTLSGQPAATLSYSGRQGKASLIWNQTFALHNGAVYGVTTTIEQSVYQKVSPTMAKVADSFRFQ
jgi:hypothetical protein